MSTAVWSLIALLLLGGSLLGLNRSIRRSLAAPRIVTDDEPRGLPYRNIDLPTQNGKRLFAWFIPAPAARNVPALILMHGWGGHSAAMLPLAAPLHAAGYALLLVDARCHGHSDDDSFASLPRFAEDIEAALDWLLLQEEIDHEKIGVIGHSVGAGAALLAASRRREIGAVGSLAAFAHPATMMRRWMHWKGIPEWPLGRYILAYVQRTIGHRFDDIAPCRTIAAVDCPVLLVHGRTDEVVPLGDAQQIHAARCSDRVELLVVEGSHDDFGDLTQPLAGLLAFLARNLPVLAAEKSDGSSVQENPARH